MAAGAESLTCEGETIVVNLHGALLSTTVGLSIGMRISIHVYLTDKRSKARVVYVDPENPLHCALEEPILNLGQFHWYGAASSSLASD